MMMKTLLMMLTLLLFFCVQLVSGETPLPLFLRRTAHGGS
jgi:hypothetical protein